MQTHPRLKSLFNLPYEPELNGIETLWNYLKYRWRAALTRKKVNHPNQSFVTETMVKELVFSTPRNIIKNSAHYGWKNIFKDYRSPIEQT